MFCLIAKRSNNFCDIGKFNCTKFYSCRMIAKGVNSSALGPIQSSCSHKIFVKLNLRIFPVLIRK